MKELNPRQRKFTFLLSMGYSHSRAYREAGYSSKGAKVSACKLFKNPAIHAYWQEIINDTNVLAAKHDRERAENRRKLYEQLENDTGKN